MKPIDDCRLYAFVDTAYLNGRDPVQVTRALCEGGADIIQLRAKNENPHDVRALGEAVLTVTRAAEIPLVINDYPQVAQQVGAEFCHLGQEDFFEAGVRSRVPFGLSSHSPDQAVRGCAVNPAYIAVGPVYATGTKPMAKPVTLDYVRWASANLKLPWFAIGGITQANVGDVLAAGARRICVVSAILNAPDIRGACQAFARRVRSAA